MIGLHPEALREIERAHGWYEAHREGLGDDLLDEIGRALDKVEAAPNSFPRAPENRSARRAPLDRFPYWVVFAVLDDGDVLVVAVAHAKRRAGYWRRRVSKSSR